MIKPAKRVSTHDLHEEIFLERYVRLCHWSLQLTQNDRERAEDLVHDLYLQFVHAQPDLGSIKNLDGYLYRTLHNLNISQLRRRGRQYAQPLSVVDFDSAESSLRSADPRELIRYQDDLRQVCHYAAIRKESSKAGSALILRFIHGYYPREIALVMKCTREAVEERLRVARIEARQYLQNPQNLRFLRRTTDIQAPQTGFVTPIDQLLEDLRQQIFDSRRGNCLSTDELKQFYAAQKTEICTLAHVVSCERCLNEINRLLELPLLAERFPTDSLGNDQPRNKTGSGDDGNDGGGITGTDLEVLRRRAREVLEHRPESLYVAVNGDVVAEQSITSKQCNLILNFKEDEQLEFVEILSNQQTLLLLITVEATVTIKRSIKLSDGRTLDVTLDLEATTPKLEVIYSEPLSSEATERSAVDSPRLVVQPKRPWSFASAFLSLLFSKLTAWLSPATVTATVALILIAALLLVRFNVTAVNARELLARAGTAEKALLTQSDVAVHRTINFEARRLNSTGRQRIEIWDRNGATLRRLYDENGKLIAGEWSSKDGASTIYRPGAGPQQRTSPEIAGAAILQSGELWRLDSSVKIFNAVVGNADALTVTEDKQSYLLGYRNDGVEDGLTRATLRIDKTTHRSIEQTLTVLKQGVSSEYRFVETALDEKALDMVPSSVFQPDAEFVSRAGEKVGPTETAERAETSAAPAESIASPELEIEVTYLLNRIRADLGEQVTLTRTSGGALRVEAITETEQRKAEILRALTPVQHNPAVRIEVSTADETAQRIKAKTPEREVDGREVEISNTRSPADNELRKYFSERVDGDGVDDEIRRYTARVMNYSRQALLRAAALQKLAKRFSPEQIKSLAPDARAKWLTMVQEQAVGCQSSIASVRVELQRVFPASGASGNAREEDIQTAANRLVRLSYANDDVIRRAFTVSAESGPGQMFSRDLWESLNTAEQLAKEIYRLAGND